MISILIPTLGNLPYLDLYCRSLEKHTTVPYEIVIWNNEASEDVRDFCRYNRYRYFESDNNLGITKPYNIMVEECAYDIIYLSDNDFYALPGWDVIAKEAIEVYWKRVCLIDPRIEKMNRSVIENFGTDLGSFREAELIMKTANVSVPDDVLGPYMPPVLKKQDYISIGGFNEDFFIGEQDFLWRSYTYYNNVGYTQYISSNSFMYHFGSKTPRKFPVGEKRREYTYVTETYGITPIEMDNIMGIV
jgi:GT2 family glycosyltransferase